MLVFPQVYPWSYPTNITQVLLHYIYVMETQNVNIVEYIVAMYLHESYDHPLPITEVLESQPLKEAKNVLFCGQSG